MIDEDLTALISEAWLLACFAFFSGIQSIFNTFEKIVIFFATSSFRSGCLVP